MCKKDYVKVEHQRGRLISLYLISSARSTVTGTTVDKSLNVKQKKLT